MLGSYGGNVSNDNGTEIDFILYFVQAMTSLCH